MINTQFIKELEEIITFVKTIKRSKVGELVIMVSGDKDQTWKRIK